MPRFTVGVLMSFDADNQEDAIAEFYASLNNESPDVNLIVEEGDIQDLGNVVRSFIPTADWSEDNDGQLVIYTNLTIGPDGDLVLI